MLIDYANHHSWFKSACEDSLFHYGKSDRKRLQKTIQGAAARNITYLIEPASEAFFKWFTPLYTQSIKKKPNGSVRDVESLTIGNPDNKFPYYTATLYEAGEPIGGCIFADYGWYYSIAYRMFEREWRVADLPASPALYGEYLLDCYTYEQGKKDLVHGRDRNPYGINSAIGLGIFKLAVGCKARTALTHEKLTIDTDTVTTDALVLHYPNKGRRITTATLLCTEASRPKYEQLFTYPERLTINTILRP